jgi:hypothetical protein
MYCLCHELYKVFIKPRSLYYNKCHMGENVWLFYMYVSNKKPQREHKVQKMVKKPASAVC